MTKPAAKLLALALASGLGACASTADLDTPAQHIQPLSGSPVVESFSSYSEPLRCLSAHAQRQSYPAPRIAVGHISDLTGADDYLSGRRLTQGATLMAITAASEAGMRLVERFDMGVVQVELDYAQNGLLRDSPTTLRTVERGQMEGADLYLVGGITEFNPNIRSSGTNAFANTTGDTGGAIAMGRSEYIVDVGIDLRLIDVRSTEVLSVRSLRKQIRGREVENGIYAFFDGSVLDIGGGQRALEPVQTAVRSMIDRAVFEFMAELYNLEPGACLDGAPAREAYNTAPQPAVHQPAYQPSLHQPAHRPQSAPANATPRDYVQPASSHAAPAHVAPAAQPAQRQAQQHAPAEGYAVHLGSYRTVWNLNRHWDEFSDDHADLLGGREARVQRAQLDDDSTVFRLLAGRWSNSAEAEQVCRNVRRRGGQCAVRAFGGTPVVRS